MYKNRQLLGAGLALVSASTYAMLPVFTSKAYETGLAVNTLLVFRFLIAAVLLWGIVWIKKTRMAVIV